MFIEESPHHKPVSLAKDALLVLIGLERDGEGGEFTIRLVDKLRVNLKIAGLSLTGLKNIYSRHESHHRFSHPYLDFSNGDLGLLTDEELLRIKDKYKLP